MDHRNRIGDLAGFVCSWTMRTEPLPIAMSATMTVATIMPTVTPLPKLELGFELDVLFVVVRGCCVPP